MSRNPAHPLGKIRAVRRGADFEGSRSGSGREGTKGRDPTLLLYASPRARALQIGIKVLGYKEEGYDYDLCDFHGPPPPLLGESLHRAAKLAVNQRHGWAI